jgi:hypothetical protein
MVESAKNNFFSFWLLEVEVAVLGCFLRKESMVL